MSGGAVAFSAADGAGVCVDEAAAPVGARWGRVGIGTLGCADGEFNSGGDPAGWDDNLGGGVAGESATVDCGDAPGFTRGGIGRIVAAGEPTFGDVGGAVAIDVGAGALDRGVIVGRGENAGREFVARGVADGAALCPADAVALAVGVIDDRGVAVTLGVAVAAGAGVVCGLAVAAGAVAAVLAAVAAAVAVALGAAVVAAVPVSAFATAFAGALDGGVASAMTFARACSAAARFGIPDQPLSTTALLICLFTTGGR